MGAGRRERHGRACGATAAGPEESGDRGGSRGRVPAVPADRPGRGDQARATGGGQDPRQVAQRRLVGRPGLGQRPGHRVLLRQTEDRDQRAEDSQIRCR